MTQIRLENISKKINLWIGGEQTWPKIDYLTLQSEDSQVNLRVKEYHTARCNKLWLPAFVISLARLVIEIAFFFSSDNRVVSSRFNLVF